MIQTPDFNAMTIEELQIFIDNVSARIRAKNIVNINISISNIERLYEIVMEAEKVMYAKMQPATVEVEATEADPVETVEVEAAAETKVEIATRRMVREYFPLRFGATAPVNSQVNPAIFACFLHEANLPALSSVVHEEPGLKDDVAAQTVVGLAHRFFDPAEPIAVADLMRIFREVDDMAQVPSFKALQTMVEALSIRVGEKMLKAIREELILARMGRAARRMEERRLAA